MSDRNPVRDFCHNHNIRVLDSNKRAHRMTRMNTLFFQCADDYNKVMPNFIADTERLYTVEIAESELERIAEFESQVFNHMRQQGHYNMFETLMDQKNEEKRLRETYPAVAKAYAQYSLILKLAESGEL